VVEPAIGAVYAAVLIDAIMVKIGVGQVGNRPVYPAIGVHLDGNKDVLGMWAGDGGGEPAKFWMSVLSDLRNRGVADVFFVVCAPGRRLAIRVSSSYWLSSVARSGAAGGCCSPRIPN
jgi:putative transposase